MVLPSAGLTRGRAIVLTVCVAVALFVGYVVFADPTADTSPGEVAVLNNANESVDVEIIITEDGDTVAEYDLSLQPDEEDWRYIETTGELTLTARAGELNHTRSWSNDRSTVLFVEVHPGEIDSWGAQA